jgi:hypothetical protein
MKLKALIACIFVSLFGVAITPMAKHPGPTTSIVGRITDLLGTPIPGATIEVSTEDNAQHYSANSDAQGNYQIDNLPATQLRISVRYRGFRQEEFTVSPKSLKFVVDVGLQVGNLSDAPVTKISGIVRNADAPMKDATITVTSVFNQRVVERIRTNTDGRYEIDIESPGQYVVHASKPGFMASATTVILPPTLPRGGRTVDFILLSLRLP